MNDKDQLEKIAKYQLFRYTIMWDNGVKEVLENSCIPKNWDAVNMGNKAILCPANPTANKMAELLRERNKTYTLVERESLDAITLEPTGKYSQAFLVHEISETESEELANLFSAEFFLSFKIEDDNLFIEIVPCPHVHGEEMRGLIFSFD